MIPPGFPHPDDFEAQPDHQVRWFGASMSQLFPVVFFAILFRWFVAVTSPAAAPSAPKGMEKVIATWIAGDVVDPFR